MFLKKYCVYDWHPNQKFVEEILAKKIAGFIKSISSHDTFKSAKEE